MGLLSEKNKDVLFGPLSINNPVVVQMLGICSALGRDIEAGARHRDGYLCDSRCGFCECDYFLDS